jgi:hypothetical protein
LGQDAGGLALDEEERRQLVLTEVGQFESWNWFHDLFLFFRTVLSLENGAAFASGRHFQGAF